MEKLVVTVVLNIYLALVSGLSLQLSTSPLFRELGPHTDVQLLLSSQTEVPTRANNKARLPADNPIPENYDLYLIPYLDDDAPNKAQYTVSGAVKIKVKAVGAVSQITLHSNKLKLNTKRPPTVNTLTPDDDTKFAVTPSLDEDYEFLHLKLSNPLIANNLYEISIDYSFAINQERDHGVFLKFTENEKGDAYAVVATQFEPTGAREALPCFDEPHLKSTFQISIAFGPKWDVLSNTNVEVDNDGADLPPGWKIRQFAPTNVKMSTYLLAFAIMPKDQYKSIPAEAGDGFSKPVKIYGPIGSIEDGGKFAAKIAIPILAYFQDYAGIDYHFDKLDTISLPDFEAQAMENWGLNTFTTQFLLHFDKITLESERYLLSRVVAHEFIHQWFGNWVTAEFWDQIWLNEGFANFFDFIGSDHVVPEFEPLEMRQLEQMQISMKFDASRHTHPIINPSSIQGITFLDFKSWFTHISYEKGGSLLRMLESFLGKDIMQDGLRAYLALGGRGDKTANQKHLFEILDANIPDRDKILPPLATIREIMETWTHQSGFPVVRVDKASDRRIFISQDRFVPKVIYSPDSTLDRNDLWTIPISIQTSSDKIIDPKPKIWIDKKIAMTSYGGLDLSKWILINPTGAGYYRVLYDRELFDLLVTELNREDNNDLVTLIDATSRSQLLDDYFTFVEHKMTEVETAFELTTYLHKEKSTVVWSTLKSRLTPFVNKLSGSPSHYKAIKDYMLTKVQPTLHIHLKPQQPSNEKGNRVILRSILLDWACRFGDPVCLEAATKSFADWIDNGVEIPVDTRAVFFCGAIASDDALFAKAFTQYKKQTISKLDKKLLAEALGCTNDDQQIKELLEVHILSPEKSEILAEHRSNLLQSIAQKNIKARIVVIDVVAENIKKILADQNLGVASVTEFYKALTQFVLPQSKVDILKELAEEEDLQVDLQQYLDQMDANILWADVAYLNRLKTWFEKNTN